MSMLARLACRWLLTMPGGFVEQLNMRPMPQERGERMTEPKVATSRHVRQVMGTHALHGNVHLYVGSLSVALSPEDAQWLARALVTSAREASPRMEVDDE